MEILRPVLTLGILGFLFGIGLYFASKKFCISHDPRLDKIIDKLPGSNCGACGKPGCMGFAEGLIKGECSVNKCAVSNDNAKKDIGDILGVEVKTTVKKVAVLHCNGGNKVKDRFDYRGIKDCIAANLMMGGQKACVYGCLGFGTCVEACPFGAISMGEDGLPKIDEAKCTGCGRCVEACPKDLFSLVAIDKQYYIACSSHDIGKRVMQVCKVGCIACFKCQKACPVSAIKVEDNLAEFNYDRCQNRGRCLEVCPTKVIKRRGVV